MDPITALLLAWKATAEMVTELSRGQTTEQKTAMWQWFIDDQTRWRKWLKLDADKPDAGGNLKRP
jgi:hypothetical protein